MRSSTVQTGLELFVAGRGLPTLPGGPRVGLLCHPASVDAAGRHALERLEQRRDLRIERLFAPEHGLWGHEQDMESVAESREPGSGLPVVSLYGPTEDSLRPRAEQLDGLDALLVDLQDVGSRYYTFVYTMAHLMEAAGEAGLPVIVLDRPNPLGTRRTEGPLIRPGWTSFVGRYPLPVCHGMTVGELARMVVGEFGVECELHVVPLRGWQPEQPFERSGLPWIPPSPNMPTLDTVRVYPGGCLIEGTNLSEGRGTTRPFELIGAPWIDGWALARSMRDQRLEGVAFRAASFRPMFQKHAGRSCGGIQLLVREPRTFAAFRTFLSLMREVSRQAREEFAWRTEPYEFEHERLAIDLLLGRPDLRPLLEAGAEIEDLERLWIDELEEFERRRAPYLLYS